MKWRIYYDDGTTFEGDPFLTPARGVMCILDSHGQWHIDENKDYYVWKFREDGWSGVDLFGLVDYLLEAGARKVVFGRLVENSIFNKIKQQALKDMYDQS
jgi:hypothetical protein